MAVAQSIAPRRPLLSTEQRMSSSWCPDHEEADALLGTVRSNQQGWEGSSLLPLDLQTCRAIDEDAGRLGFAAPPFLYWQLRVDLRGEDRGVAEDLLDVADIGAGGDQQGGHGMAERMRCDVPFDFGEPHVLLEDVLD